MMSMEHTAVQLDDEEPTLFTDSIETEVSGDLATESKAAPSAPSPVPSSSWVSLLTLEYYQSFFDVSTKQVCVRTLAGMTPFYLILVDTLGVNPDLYGPFWLAVTLIITNAVCGNISNFMQVGSQWEFHFAEVTTLATVVLVYIWVMPVLVWGVLWWRGGRKIYTLLQLLAIYGYSMATFIPLSVLWTIHSEVLRWCLLAVGIGLSGGVLGRSLWKPLSEDSKKAAMVILVSVVLVHCAVSVGFKFLIFSSYHDYPPQLQTLVDSEVAASNHSIMS